jgi:hypothetical protein
MSWRRAWAAVPRSAYGGVEECQWVSRREQRQPLGGPHSAKAETRQVARTGAGEAARVQAVPHVCARCQRGV